MDLSTLILFLCCLLFSVFSFWVNGRVYDSQWLKLLTFILGVASALGALFVLVISFIQYLK